MYCKYTRDARNKPVCRPLKTLKRAYHPHKHGCSRVVAVLTSIYNKIFAYKEHYIRTSRTLNERFIFNVNLV